MWTLNTKDIREIVMLKIILELSYWGLKEENFNEKKNFLTGIGLEE